MNVACILEAGAEYFPDRTAVIEGGRQVRYGELEAKAGRMAAALSRLGLGPGDVAAICLPGSSDWLAFYFGALKAGCRVATLFHGATGDELKRLAADCQPAVVFTTEDKKANLLEESGRAGFRGLFTPSDLERSEAFAGFTSMNFRAVYRDRDDVAAILYTGGTTGTAKGVLLTHQNLLVSAHHVARYERSTETDRALCFLPLHHVFGQVHIMLATFLTAGTLILRPGFDLDDVLGVIREFQVTKFFAVPTIYIRLLDRPALAERFRSVRYCFSAAANMAREVVNQWKEKTGLAIHESYGLTESAAMVTFNHYYRHVVGSVGTPVGTVEVSIRDMGGQVLEPGRQGEITIKGPNVMKGYLGRPEETLSAFHGSWFRSGDVGMMDEAGYLYIVDRIKDMIITGGENVYPREIEEYLHQHPEVAECTVVGLPDAEYGERVAAVIVPRPGTVIVPQTIRAFLRERLSGYKVPKEYVVVDDLPRSAAGKVLKREVRRRLTEKK
ncbi:MAG: AMP-binding protein [Thermodesulfobacteriota bacterium]